MYEKSLSSFANLFNLDVVSEERNDGEKGKKEEIILMEHVP